MRPWNTTIIGLALVGLFACDGGEKPEENNPAPAANPTTEAAVSEADIGDVLAVVNGANVGSTAFEQAASRRVPAEGDTLSMEEKQEVLDRLIDEELLYQEALRQGLDRDPKVKKVMVNTLLRQEVYSSVRNSDFTDEELEAYYEANKDEFIVPEKVQIKRILIKFGEDRTEEEARTLADELRTQVASNPAEFKDVATQHSEDPYRRRGGDVGFVAQAGKPGLDQEIVDRAFDMDVDAVSEVFVTSEGFNIIQVANRRERVERTYQQMKGSVLRKVKNEKLADMYDQYTENLRTGAMVSVESDTLSGIEVKSARRGGPGGGMQPSLPDINAAAAEGGEAGGGE